MSDNYLMRKGEGTIFVPPLKLAQYLADGWVVVQEPDPKPEVKKVEELPPPLPAVEEAEPVAVSVDESVEKLGSRNKRAKRG